MTKIDEKIIEAKQRKMKGLIEIFKDPKCTEPEINLSEFIFIKDWEKAIIPILQQNTSVLSARFYDHGWRHQIKDPNYIHIKKQIRAICKRNRRKDNIRIRREHYCG